MDVDFPDETSRDHDAAFGIVDGEARTVRCRSTRDEKPGIHTSPGRFKVALLQRGAVNRDDAAAAPSRGQQGGLSQPVAGQESCSRKTTCAEAPRESLERARL